MSDILLLEDDRSLSAGIVSALSEDGHTVTPAYTCSQALGMLNREFELYILDINLPDGSGLSFCEKIKQRSSKPVVFLTADDTEEDMLKGFTAGCDDYISKPFSVAVLRKKIVAILKRSGGLQENSVYSHNGLSVDYNKMLVSVNGNECKLTAAEYKLLAYMTENSGRVLTRGMMLEQLWDTDGNYVDENTLSVLIRRLRAKIEPNPSEPIYIITVFGIGYTLGE